MRIEREDLYTQIWSEPATKVASRLGVSSSYLARVCEALNIPHPPRGYWARKAAGEKVVAAALPPALPGDPIAWVKGIAITERLPPLERPGRASHAKSRGGPPPRPTHHPLVTAWKNYLEEASPTENGYMVPRKKNVLDAFVTKGMIRGAVDALNALLVELEIRGHRVRLAEDYSSHRPLVDVALRKITDQYTRRPDQWQPGRPTLAYVSGAVIGLTLFELTEHVRVRRMGSDRYVRISDLPPVRRYAPQAPDESDLTRDMPTGRFVLRAYSPIRDVEWRQEWTEKQSGEFVTLAKIIADSLEEAVPVLAKLVEEAELRERERLARQQEEWRRYKAQERARAQEQARKAAIDELRSIVEAWNAAFALEAFFNELTRRATSLDGEARTSLEGRIRAARNLMGGQDAVDRFLRWKLPTRARADGGDAEDGDD